MLASPCISTFRLDCSPAGRPLLALRCQEDHASVASKAKNDRENPMTVEIVTITKTFNTRWGKAECRACWKTIEFVNPTPERIRWYKDSHRCGGEGWQG